MIEGYVGRPGSGKTYTLTERALRWIKNGEPVFSNYPIKGAKLFGPHDLLELPPGKIVIDEAHLWFPARGSLRLPPSWMHKLSQTRKSGWDLYWSTQHENRVDRVLRDISNWQWLCRAYFPSAEGHPWLFVATAYEPEFFRNDKYRGARTYRMFRKRVAEAYDTRGEVAIADHYHSKKDVYLTDAPSSKPKTTKVTEWVTS